ncbi:MAG: prepilin-type N-terminal cleavage/methylation domain-containing protein [Fuerstiella sp.]|nr:prepilin-type N-terminal cleavage/methylation domain-containing protein [Fuerstiella sp.]
MMYNKQGIKGFTLVEMLVSVTLVLLMMTMFTAIFEMATDSVSKQQGIAKNDQQARALTTIIKADISKRSFRYVQPFCPTESSATSPTSLGPRAGSLYISTNDTASGLDDLLQFTVNASLTQETTDDSQFFGSARLLYDLAADPDFGDKARRTTLRFNPNQPDADDSNLSANNVGGSSAAEISYFVRGGALYRRVMLLREPLAVAGEDLSVQPVSNVGDNQYTNSIGTGVNIGGVLAYVQAPLNINQTNSGNADHFALSTGQTAPLAWNVRATNDFWRHFDYAATPVLTGAPPFIPTDVQFVGIDSLSNDDPSPTARSLGIPWVRFGFNAVTGLSREHNDPVERLFLGRFTHAETSDPDFNWPMAACRTANTDEVSVPLGSGQSYAGLNTGAAIGNGNPMDLVGTRLNLRQSTGVIAEFDGTSGRGGSRKVEDLLLNNVHEFKVEIWDDRLQRFVVPSHNYRTQIQAGGTTTVVHGDYNSSRRLNQNYGPSLPISGASRARNHVFDTWTPNGLTTLPIRSFDLDGSGGISQNEASAPFVPYRYYPPRRGDSPPGPSPNSMTDPSAEVDRQTGVARNRGYWDPDNEYAVGDVVFAVPATFVANNVVGWDADGDGVFEWDQDGQTGFGNLPGQGFQIAYRCVQDGYTGTDAPSWPSVPGQRFSGVAVGGAQGAPDVWVSLDNRRPLRSIRMKVQFFDQITEKLRQLTLVLPLTTDR